jgi:metal-responsive CopG/Arc/MetJ family transcriptional regulator
MEPIKMVAKSKTPESSKRVNVSLPAEAISKLQEISQRRGVTMTEAIRIAINTEDYLQNEIAKGGKIIVEKPDKSFREVVFR